MDGINLDDIRLGSVGTSDMGVDALEKALQAGASADPYNMGTGGNTLQFESLEGAIVNMLAEQNEDFKLMKLQNSVNVGSTNHQYTQRNDSGSIEGVNVAELSSSIDSNSTYTRKVRNIKFFQTRREASLQAQLLNPIVGKTPAESEEEFNGTHVLMKATEYTSFHGDEAVVPNQPDGYLAQIRNEAPGNVRDFEGKRITDTGMKEKIDQLIGDISLLGGEISDMLFPYALTQEFSRLLDDGIRTNFENKKVGSAITMIYQHNFGKAVNIAGRAGNDKMFFVKNVPNPSSDEILTKPLAPSIAVVGEAKATDSKGFTATTAGTYRFSVYAVDANGLVSDKSSYVDVALVAGQQANITITPNATRGGSGFIVCRGKKDETTDDVREMFRIANSGLATTTALDQDEELPGTASILLLTSDQYQATYQWLSYTSIKRFNLYPTDKASIPFLMLWYGSPDLKKETFNGVIKNVGHAGVDGWFA